MQTGTSGVVDRVEFLYNRLSEKIAKRDQNGTMHAFEYDNLGRLLHDKVLTFAPNVDTLVQKVSTGYNVIGSIESITSYAANGNVINQVKYEYGSNQKLARQYQSHSGAVNLSATPCVQYGYAGVANGLRLETMTYPNGKELAYNYDDFGNVSAITENNESVVSYEYAGKSAMKTTYNEPNLSLNYEDGGLDRFGRIIDHAWKQGTADVVRIQHGYDTVWLRIGIERLPVKFSKRYRVDATSESFLSCGIRSTSQRGETYNHVC